MSSYLYNTVNGQIPAAVHMANIHECPVSHSVLFTIPTSARFLSINPISYLEVARLETKPVSPMPRGRDWPRLQDEGAFFVVLSSTSLDVAYNRKHAAHANSGVYGFNRIQVQQDLADHWATGDWHNFTKSPIKASKQIWDLWMHEEYICFCAYTFNCFRFSPFVPHHPA